MSYRDRRRTSPWRQDRRPPGREGRRYRSVSPPPGEGRDRYRRPTEPFRHPRRDYRDDRRDRDHRRYRDDDRDRYRDRYESPSQESNKSEGPNEPLTFKQFMVKKIDDNVDPKQAQEKYNEYLIEYHGSEDKVEFEKKKNEVDVREMFDPRKIADRLNARKERSKQSADEFARDYQDGVINKDSEDFNQGLGSNAPKFKYKIDDLVKNALQEYKRKHQQTENGSKQEDKKDQKSREENGKDIKKGDKKNEVNINQIEIITSDGVGWAPLIFYLPEIIEKDTNTVRQLIPKLDEQKSIQADPFKLKDVNQNQENKDKNDTDQEMKEDSQQDEQNQSEEKIDIKQLDLMLQYLWIVHGIDYYGGYELAEQDFQIRIEKPRTIRLPLPNNVDDDFYSMQREYKDLISQYDSKIIQFWTHRAEINDPAYEPMQQERVDTELEAWVEKNVVKHEDNKWGCELSDKKFVAKSYVVKHIKNKHSDKYLAQKDKIQDQVFLENYIKAKSEIRKTQKEQQELQQKWDNQGFDEQDEENVRAQNASMRRRVHRPPYPGFMQQPFMGGHMMPQMMPQMMVPGAYPFGAFMAPYGGGGYPFDMQAQFMNQMHARGRGRGRDYYGGRVDRGRQYHDYDDPTNNRQIIDYDDL